MGEPGRQRVQEAKPPQRTAAQRETHEGAVTAQHQEVKPPVPAGEPWPEASAVPGDEERLAGMLAGLAQITDVGSLARLLQAVVTQCQRQRVKPEVLRATVQP